MSEAVRERLVVVWRVTERCPLRCGFCAYDRRVERSRRSVDPERVRRFAAALAAHERATGMPVLLTFLGGEPMTWAPLAGLAQELFGTHGLRLGVTTSGVTLGDPAALAAAARDYAEITLSVDGIGEVHDRLRGWPGGFARLALAVAALVAAGPPARRPLVRINTVLMRDTARDFPALLDVLAGWGVDEITFNPLGGNDRPEFFVDHGLTAAQAAWVAAELPAWQAALAARGVMLLGGARYRERLVASARGERLPVADCAPGERFLFVDEDGRAAPCSFTAASYGVPVEELCAPGALAALPERLRAARARWRLPVCGDCGQTNVHEKFVRPAPAGEGILER